MHSLGGRLPGLGLVLGLIRYMLIQKRHMTVRSPRITPSNLRFCLRTDLLRRYFLTLMLVQCCESFVLGGMDGVCLMLLNNETKDLTCIDNSKGKQRLIYKTILSACAAVNAREKKSGKLVDPDNRLRNNNGTDVLMHHHL